MQNILKDSHYCFDSLAIRLRSKDLKTPYPKNRTTQITGLECIYSLTRGKTAFKFLRKEVRLGFAHSLIKNINKQ